MALSENAQQLIASLKGLESEKIALINKIQDLEQEKKEYKLVLDVFETVEPSRRCCRMVGTVLVPRTVEEVKPALEASSNKISEALMKLREDLEQVISKHAVVAAKLQPLLSTDGTVQQQAPVEA